MITVFVSKEGYYIYGDSVEAALRCSPALDDCGKPIFHELHHTYKVMFLALQMIAKKGKMDDDIIVYNDSRIVDELNGNVQPLDEVCQRWRQVIRREIIPHIRSIVTFRKRAQTFISSKMMAAENLIMPKDPVALQELAEKIDLIQQEKSRSKKESVLAKFKRIWKNGEQQ